MFNKWAKNTLDPELSEKQHFPCGHPIPDLNQKMLDYFLKTYDLYEKLFTIIKCELSYYSHPEPLRHPLIFYFGHTAAFYVNKLMDKGIIKNHVNESFERMFAVGVDQNDWDDLDESHYCWPSVNQVKLFREEVKNVVTKAIKDNKEDVIDWKSDMWIVMMAIDHERLHLETSAVIIRRLPVQQVTSSPWIKQCPFVRNQISNVPLNCMKKVPPLNQSYDKPIEKADYYGWDCEFGNRQIITKEFKASKMLVSNAEFLQFFLDDGYKNLDNWTDQGKKWLKVNKIQKPVFWIINGENRKDPKNYFLKTLTKLILMPWDWPAEVNNLEARAFCKWKSEKTGRNLRLPTEDEYYALRNLLKQDYHDWKYQCVGNINLEFWCSPCPVDLFQIEGFCDIVGNVLQHTTTPLFPFNKFKIHPLYEDFTTPCLDNRHDVIKGGCFINTGNSASKYYRTGFRRHFYLFTGFRYVESENPTQISEETLCQSDESVRQALQIQFLTKDSYILKILNYIFAFKKQLGGKSLVVGCSVGRLPLQLSKLFDQSYGIDYTARYFQMAARLLQKQILSYQGLKIQLKNLELNSELLKKVRLYQMNPLNPDSKKINDITFITIDGFNLRKDTITEVIQNCFRLFKHNTLCYALVICPTQTNCIKQAEQELQKTLKNIASFKTLDSFDLQNGLKRQKEKAKAFFIEVQIEHKP